MGDMRRTVVIEMTDELYRELARSAENEGFTLAELLIGHACTTELNARAIAGDLRGWKVLLSAWRDTDPRHAPAVMQDEMFIDA